MPPIDTDPDAVAALLRTRTMDENGVEGGVFTETTRPTLEQVEHLVEEARRKVVGIIGTAEPCTADLTADAANVVHLRAAMLVELSYFPEQINTNRSPYEQLKDLYDTDVKSLAEAIAETCGTGIGEEGVNNQVPSYGYGEAPVIGKRTVW